MPRAAETSSSSSSSSSSGAREIAAQSWWWWWCSGLHQYRTARAETGHSQPPSRRSRNVPMRPCDADAVSNTAVLKAGTSAASSIRRPSLQKFVSE
jgi:hypothetical protein